MLCSREQLLGLTDVRYCTVDVADLSFRIRSLSEAEKSEFETSILSSEGKYSLAKIKRQRRRLIAICLVDQSGGQLLKGDDQNALKDVDGLVTSRLYDACREHCGFEEGDIEGLVKNSDKIPDDALPTD